jgi:DNA-binding NtrC family response regulator
MNDVRPVILVVDDEADSLKLLTDLLCTQGYEVRAANSGKLALASAAAHTPDLILLDLRMPEMDGLEVCRRLKASEATRSIPLMFISGTSDVEQRVQGLALGAVDFVTKPFRREELVARVQAHLELGRLRDNLEREVQRRTAELSAMAEELQRGKARLEQAAELAELGYYEFDFSGGLVFWDQRARSILGNPSSDGADAMEVSKFWQERVAPEDSPKILDIRDRLRNGPLDRVDVEYRYQHPVEGKRWIHHRVDVARRDASGTAVFMYGVLQDVTKRRQAEEDLRQSCAEIKRLKDRLQAEGDYLKAEMRMTQDQGSVIGESAGIRKVLRMVEQVAPTDSSVLIRGETGTGKELIAQAVHRLSSRRNNLLVKVNCAALPAGLVESELFGRERGAYTGAMARQVGRFEVADGSTLFLDEIGELPLDLQAKLLRVLESGEFERLGSSKTLKVNVRVIAATNRNLQEAVKEGKFREDLFYRLNVFPILVPPLRERAEDIPLLVWAFLQEFCTRMGKKITQVPRKTMEALQRYPWPGNVRELRNVIEHGAIITTGDVLTVPLLDEADSAAAMDIQTLAEAERAHILRILERTNWHIKGPQGAAALLGMNPGTLYGRMKKLDIRPRQRAKNGEE